MTQQLAWQDAFQSLLDTLQMRSGQGAFFKNGDRVALMYLRLLKAGEPFTDDDVVKAVADSMPHDALQFSDSPNKPEARPRWVAYVRKVEEALASADPSGVLRVYSGA